MNLTPRWQEIQQSYPDVHVALTQIASMFYKQNTEFMAITEPISTLQVDGVNGVDLSRALELGFLTNNNDKIAFSELGVLSNYLVRHAIGLALAAWDDIETFNKVFGEIESRSFLVEADHELGADVLILLAYEYKKNIVDRMAEIISQGYAEKNSPFWTFYRPFCKVLPQFDFFSKHA